MDPKHYHPCLQTAFFVFVFFFVDLGGISNQSFHKSYHYSWIIPENTWQYKRFSNIKWKECWSGRQAKPKGSDGRMASKTSESEKYSVLGLTNWNITSMFDKVNLINLHWHTAAGLVFLIFHKHLSLNMIQPASSYLGQ